MNDERKNPRFSKGRREVSREAGRNGSDDFFKRRDRDSSRRDDSRRDDSRRDDNRWSGGRSSERRDDSRRDDNRWSGGRSSERRDDRRDDNRRDDRSRVQGGFRSKDRDGADDRAPRRGGNFGEGRPFARSDSNNSSRGGERRFSRDGSRGFDRSSDRGPRRTSVRIQNHIVSAEDAGVNLSAWMQKHFSALTQDKLDFFASKDAVRVNGESIMSSGIVSAGDKISFPDHILQERDGATFSDQDRPQRRSYPRDGERRGSDDRGGRRDFGRGRRNENDASKTREYGDKADDPKRKFLMASAPSWVICRDEHIIAINKPAGLPTQGGTAISVSLDDIAAEALAFDRIRPKLVHRLDIGTSGVIVMARSDDAVRELGAAFSGREVDKRYYAVLCGVPKERSGVIDFPLMKKQQGSDKESIQYDPEGKDAVTKYEVLSDDGNFSLVAFEIETGRTHQIRVHSSMIGHPVLGDRKYGTKRSMYEEMESSDYLEKMDFYVNAHKNEKFMYLHAQSVKFSLFDRNYHIAAPLPGYFESFLKKNEITY